MCDCEYHQYLNAYHDGELDDRARREVEQHVKTCCLCGARLDALRRMSGLIQAEARLRAPADAVRPDELARMHGAVSRAAREVNDRPLLRIAGALSAIAASVLIISGVWLVELRDRQPTMVGGSTVVQVNAPTVAVGFPQPWEQVATGHYVPPVYLGNDQGYQPAEPALAYNNRELANYIYEGLSR